MPLDSVLYHNIGEVVPSAMGDKLQRYPAAVEKTMIPAGRSMSHYACGTELRFVADRRTLVTVMSYLGNGEAIVYSGDFQHSHHALPQGVAVTITLEAGEVFGRVNEEYTAGQRFSRHVWRIAFKNANVAVLNVEHFGDELRLPKPEEMPAKTMLAYGSSITHGSGALNSSDTYVEHLARRLGCDVLNKGLGGACFCEPGVADYFADKLQWDFALLEIGINMVNTIPVDEYEKRLRYMLDRVTAAGKPIFMVNIYRFSHDYSPEPTTITANVKDYRDTFRKVYADYADKNCTLIEGEEILARPEYLTSDGIHPSSYGHIMMGENLAAKMKGKLQELGVL